MPKERPPDGEIERPVKQLVSLKYILSGNGAYVTIIMIAALVVLWNKANMQVAFSDFKESSISLKAEAFLKNGQYDKAIAQYRALIRMNPENFEHHWNLGVAYAKKGDLDNAMGEVKRLRNFGKDQLADQLKKYILEQP